MNNIFDLVFDKKEEVTPAPILIPQPVQQPQTINKGLLDPCISDMDIAHVENLTFDAGEGNYRTVQFNIPAKPTVPHAVAMWETIDQFETKAWSNNSGGLKTGFKSFDKAFDGGWKPGFYVIGGDSNVGKSIMITQIAWKALENNNNIYIMDFSLDDPMQDKLARLIASWNKVIINSVKAPQMYSQYPLMLLRRKEGINKLRQYSNKYRSYDSTFSSYIEDIEEEVQRMKIEMEIINPDIQMMVCIDSFHDLYIKAKTNITETQKFNEIAQWAADLAIKYNLVLICTAEIRKAESNKDYRLNVNMLRESIKLRFESKAIMLVYNDVHYKGDNADIFFLKQNSTEKQPVFEVQIVKNKFHNFKGRFFYYMYPELAYLEEVDDNTAKNFANLIT